MVQIKKNIGKCEILPLALHLARTGHYIYIYIYVNLKTSLPVATPDCSDIL